MNTVSPCEPAGQVPIGGLSAACAGRISPPDNIVPPRRPAPPCNRVRRDRDELKARSNGFFVIIFLREIFHNGQWDQAPEVRPRCTAIGRTVSLNAAVGNLTLVELGALIYRVTICSV